MGLVERPSILAQFVGERRIVEQGVQHGLELASVGIEQAAVAAQALADQHVATSVGEHRPPERPRLERHHRQALEVGRHHQRLGAGDDVELVLVASRSPRWRMRGCVGNRQHRRADQHQVERTIVAARSSA